MNDFSPVNNPPWPTAQQKKATTRIYYDAENCLVPSDLHPHDVFNAIRQTLVHHGYTGPIKLMRAVVANANRPDYPPSRVLMYQLLAQPVVDGVIIEEINNWLEEDPPYTNVLVISGDVDYLGVIRNVGVQHNVMLDLPHCVNLALKRHMRLQFTCRYLLGLPLEKGKTYYPTKRRDKSPDGGKGGRRRSTRERFSRSLSNLVSVFSCFKA